MFEKKEKISPLQRRAVFNRIRPVIARELEIKEENITFSSHLKDLGGDSVRAIEIVMALEGEFNIEIPDEQIDKMSTVEDIIIYLAGRVKF
ncbi:MAG: acyl carrier protein [Candidatus Omnitrophica bacterium]|nr:acyl carrier protein [Candidatus Omnitrophota bacterium]